MGTLFGNRNASGPHNRRNAGIIGGLTGGAGAMIHSGMRAAKGLPGMTKQHMKGAAIGSTVGGAAAGKATGRGASKGAIKGAAGYGAHSGVTSGLSTGVGSTIGKLVRKAKGK